MGAENDAFTAFSFISFVVVLIPLPWHMEVWNTGTCLYMLWTATGCFILFIDSIIWDGSTDNWAPIWCDITTRLLVGVSVAIPAASLCINRRLFTIARVRTVTITWADKRRAILIDLSIGLGIPIIVMILQYVVQGHRFDIFEDLGCRTFTYNTPLAYPLVFLPPVVLGMISAVFAALTIRAFSLRHTEFKQFMSSNNLITFNRYLRLMVLAAIDILLTVPFTTYIVYSNLKYGRIAPWVSWEDTHSGFSRIDEYPAAAWQMNPASHVSLELTRWGVVICALLFFALFGFADEAMKNYRKAYGHVVSRLGVGTTFSTTMNGTPVSNSNGLKSLQISTANSLPVFIRRDVVRKTDSSSSLSTISDEVSIRTPKHPSPSGSPFRVASPSIHGEKHEEKADPMTATTESFYSQPSAPTNSPLERTERRNSFPVSVSASQSFLNMTSARPHDSMLSSQLPQDRV